MAHYLQSLPDGWTIYVWIVAAAAILVAAVFFMWWAAKNHQFDEDIKYNVFSDDDKDRMSPEEYAKFQEVRAKQMALREQMLKEKEQERQRQEQAHRRQHAKR